MSVQFEVIPSSQKSINWIQIEHTAMGYVPECCKPAFSALTPKLRKTGELIAPIRILEAPSFIGFGSNLTLLLSVFEVNEEDRDDVVNGYEHYIEQSDALRLLDAWSSIKQTYEVSTTMGRAICEMEIQFALTIALAEVLNGWVVSKDEVPEFSLQIGIFSIDNFKRQISRILNKGYRPFGGKH